MPRRESSDEVKQFALALYEALEAVAPNAFVGAYPGRETTLDGAFDLEAVAEEMLRRLKR